MGTIGKKISSIIFGSLILTLFYFVGSFFAFIFNSSVPGAVIGLVCLLIFLLSTKRTPKALLDSSAFLVPLLPLFIIPSSVGIMDLGYILENESFPILVALTIGLFFTILIMPFVLNFFIKVCK